MSVILLNGHKLIKHETDVNFDKYQSRHTFPLVDGNKIIKKLDRTLSLSNHKDNKNTKDDLYKTLNNVNTEVMKKYCKIILEKVYNKSNNVVDINKSIKLFQTAFIEMEALLINEPRKQKDKNWFDHVLGVLENILSWPNPTIEECIVAMLHDSVEDIPGYTVQHVKEVYWETIANSINNISKQPLEYYIKNKDHNKIVLNNLETKDDNWDRKELISQITKNTRSQDYYWDIPNWNVTEINVKFADRLNALNTMYIEDENWKTKLDKDQLIKKIKETEQYFLIPELKSKTSDFHYNKLEKKHLERKKVIKNQNIEF